MPNDYPVKWRFAMNGIIFKIKGTSIILLPLRKGSTHDKIIFWNTYFAANPQWMHS